MIDETLIASLGVGDDETMALLGEVFGEKAGAEDSMDTVLIDQATDLREDQGRPARRHRRAGVPAGVARSTSAARRHRRLIGKDIARASSRSTRSDEHRHLAPQAHRRGARDAAKAAARRDPQGGPDRKGIVKNIADFGVFVDLGGIDGLLHITDMSWGRINHPSEMLKIDDEGRGQGPQHRPRARAHRPRPQAEERFAVGEHRGEVPGRLKRINGEVVNLMSYGAFVKLEDGVEGLVHISEMSWTKRVNHPNESSSRATRSRSSCSRSTRRSRDLARHEADRGQPVGLVAENYPPGTVIEGKVRNLDQLRRVHRDRGASTACCTSPT
jgi:predicted RNA-binding protein with RPS1 domain